MHKNQKHTLLASVYIIHVCICLLPSQHLGEPAELESSSVSNGIDGHVPNYSPPSNSNGRFITVAELHKQIKLRTVVGDLPALPLSLTVTMLRALYEYSATDSEELSFPEGAVIELIRTDDNGVDDGYWEGRYEGQVGVFPSVVVEVISNGMVSVCVYHGHV